MRRFTTPIYTFTLPMATDEYSAMLLTFMQGTTVLNKTMDDLTLEGNVATIQLTQEETGAFEVTEGDCPNKADLVEIQLRALDNEGNAYGSNIWKEPVRRSLSNEVLQ